MMNFNLDNLNEVIEDVLIEFCETFPIPDFNKDEHLNHLRSVLEQMGLDVFLSNEIFEAISLAPQKFTLEADTKKQSKAAKEAERLHLVSLGYGNYGKKKGGPATHRIDKKTDKLVPIQQQPVVKPTTKPTLKPTIKPNAKTNEVLIKN